MKRILTHTRRGQLLSGAQPPPIDPSIANLPIKNSRVEERAPPLHQRQMEQYMLRDYAMPNLEAV
ncbi:hypothetical protein EPI10_016375 [Gossypium australe]|uniref:Uncharacterized protein n=1 Tax=Gossypium australe TaxID=47621 RepID=A0A5B6VNJ2_9ROSI|nr:hypothetical protein EPI10_016375 [Gossypium australe]